MADISARHCCALTRSRVTFVLFWPGKRIPRFVNGTYSDVVSWVSHVLRVNAGVDVQHGSICVQ